MENSKAPSDWTVPGAGIVVDSVDYQVHYHVPQSDSTDVKGNECERLQSPHELLSKCMDAIAPLLCGYLWHREKFSLGVKETLTNRRHQSSSILENDKSILWSLVGKTAYGDNIEDEWFIVYLLKRITECVPGTVASVRDNSDGEFLLIEAAEALPEWVTPDTAQDRMYIYQGCFHLIPQPSSPAMIGFIPIGPPDVTSAVRLVAGIPRRLCDTRAPVGVGQAIERRLAVYPEHARRSVHTARCYIPRDIASVLVQRPDLVAPAVNAFYLRDPVDMKRCSPMATFRPSTRVMASVAFTRCLYAQLMHQRFEAGAAVFGRRPSPTSKDFKAHDLGAKLAIGFEILATRRAFTAVTTTPAQSSPISAEAAVAECCHGPRWESFLHTLHSNGYFRDNIEGSREFKRLKSEACEFFAKDIHGTSVTNNTKQNPGQPDTVPFLDRAAAQLGATLMQLRALRESNASHPSGSAPSQREPPDVPALRIRDDVDDDDTWLTLGESALDQLVRERWGNEPHPDLAASNSAAGGAQMDALVNTMKGFVTSSSSHEGAEVSDDLSQYFGGGDNDGEFDDDVDDDASDDGEPFDAETLGGENSNVSFSDFGAFEHTLQALLNTSARPSFDTPDSTQNHNSATMQKHQCNKDPTPTSTTASASTGTTTGTGGTQRDESEEDTDTPAAEAHDNDIEALASLMDEELAGTDVGQTFARAEHTENDNSADTTSDTGGPLDPIDIDVNLVRNVLQSYSAQQGLAGPASTLLGSLGMVLPHDEDATDADDAAGTKTN
eukprot:m.232676 g.232676  ORF g.232676 m.232676 type:complete len:779 (+) comp19282_c0_seq4:130-2466(+)